MAGIAKPSEAGYEANYEILELVSTTASGGTIDSCGLFNGLTPNEWNGANVMYFRSPSSYITIKINNGFNIWRCGTSNWAYRSAPLTIYKYDEVLDTWNDISSSVTQNLSQISNSQWEKWIAGLPKGTYRFNGGSSEPYRIDSEWYIERLPEPVVIKKDNNYYTIDPSYYDVTTGTYNPIAGLNSGDISSLGFEVSNMFAEITVGSETFKPIDKFDNFTFVTTEEKTFKLSGIKTDTAMIVTLDPISLSKYVTINKITPNGTGNIKFAFSFDKGVTWETYDTTLGVWNELIGVFIPNKDYNNFSSTDKTNWDNSKTKILSDGISVRDLPNVNFNIGKKTMMIAIVLERLTYDDMAILNDLEILYGSSKTYIGLDRGDCGVTISSTIVTLTPKITCDELLLVMTTSAS